MFPGFRWDMRLTDEKIIRTLAGLNQPVNQIEIARMVGCSEITVRRAIRRLNQVISKHGSGRRLPYTYSINYEALPDDLRKELCPK